MLQNLFPEIKYTGSTRARPGTFLPALLQVLVLYAVIYFYRFEVNNGLRELLPWFAGGFIVHSLVPARFRPFVFVMLTVSAILFYIGWLVGGLIVAAICSFVAVAHLPVPYRLRIVLLLAMGAGLVALRSQVIYAPRLTLISAISGLFLMFRFILYVHEIRYEKNKPTLWQRLSYFFMLPNLCFPLFPIVDYKTFLNGQYSEAIEETWRTGIRRIFRGIVHLLVYRFVYYYVIPSPLNLQGPFDFLLYIITTYQLIMRMSGIFYIATGTLQLFGYKLPPIFSNYFLIPSFSEIWRRINIYWKDFVTKVFYYPIWFRLRKVKGINAVLVTGLITFFITWQLHSWQWFWVLGRFPFSRIDMLYWMILGGVITVNMVINEKRPPRKQPENTWAFASSLSLVSRILGINLFMAFIWSLWNSPSVSSWLFLVHHLAEGNLQSWLLTCVTLAGALAAGTAIHYFVIRYRIDIDKPMTIRSTALLVLLSCTLMLLPVIPASSHLLTPAQEEFLRSLRSNGLNDFDRGNSEQGYYEQLLEDPARSNPWEIRVKNAGGRKGSEDMIIQTKNILQRRLKPSSYTKVEFYSVSVNRWGMRDKEYELEKPAGTFRIVLLGGSYEMGVGVNDHENYESIVEDELNRLLVKNDSINKIEILNFGVGGYHLMQQVWLCENEVFRFKPDLVIYMAHSEDPRRLNGFFASLIQNGVALEYPYLEQVKARSGVQQNMGRDEIRSRSLPFNDSIFDWGYRQIVSGCRAHGADATWIYLPATADKENPAEKNRMVAQARAAGFHTVLVNDPYKGVEIRSIQVSDSDSHPNAAGHRLIASAILYSLLEDQTQVFRKLQFQNNR